MITASAVIISGPSGGSGGGGGGTPGGSPTQLQFNNTVFGGVPGSAVNATTGAITLTAAASTTPLTVFGATTQDVPTVLFQSGVDASQLNLYVATDTAAFNVLDVTGSKLTISAFGGICHITGVNSDGSSFDIGSAAIGFFSATPAGKQIVTGAKLPSDTVMASLLAALVAYGLITDSTT